MKKVFASTLVLAITLFSFSSVAEEWEPTVSKLKTALINAGMAEQVRVFERTLADGANQARKKHSKNMATVSWTEWVGSLNGHSQTHTATLRLESNGTAVFEGQKLWDASNEDNVVVKSKPISTLLGVSRHLIEKTNDGWRMETHIPTTSKFTLRLGGRRGINLGMFSGWVQKKLRRLGSTKAKTPN